MIDTGAAEDPSQLLISQSAVGKLGLSIDYALCRVNLYCNSQTRTELIEDR